MKYFNLLMVVLLCCFVSFSSCNSGEADRKDDARESLTVPQTPSSTTATTPSPEPAQNAAGVWHYTCTAGCSGGAASAGTCSQCGGALAHNQAYHAQNNATSTPSTTAPIAPNNPTLKPPSATTPEPAQNAAGVWHYTCGAGCSGGAGSAGTCSTCGGALAHNPDYHK